jgi:hypothetical protein
MMHWREYFALANRLSWQAVDVPENRVEDFKSRVNCTEAMYHAFKARLIEDGFIVRTPNAVIHTEPGVE